MKRHAFMTAPELCGEDFIGESWTVHREVIARLWDGYARLISATAMELLGSENLPSEAPGELYLAFGRRSSKTRLEAVAGVHAWAEDYRPPWRAWLWHRGIVPKFSTPACARNLKKLASQQHHAFVFAHTFS